MNYSFYIDHTLLKPDATMQQIEMLCEEAKEHQFCSVCINPSYVETAQKYLKDSVVKICTVVGFPLGATSTLGKMAETKQAITGGATEIDMVINIGFLKNGWYEKVREDIFCVRGTCEKSILKVIIETGALTNEEKIKACKIAVKAGADFVKTSTGFGYGGATVEDVCLMKKTVDDKAKIKASGGIRSLADAQKMIEAGADRLGTSAGVAIVSGGNSTTAY